MLMEMSLQSLMLLNAVPENDALPCQCLEMALKKGSARDQRKCNDEWLAQTSIP
jgi:hypothetical protein